MMLGSIIISPGYGVWLAVPALGAALILLLWSYRRWPEVTVVHKIALCLRLLGVLALILCLIEPLWSGKRAKTGANLFAVIADNSTGMNIKDLDNKLSRGEILQAALNADKAAWLGTLAGNFQLRQYIFDSRLRRTTDFSDLTFDGQASAIGASLRTIAERYRGRPLAGVLLMTDGNATDMADELNDLSGVPPVYPVAIGGKQPQKDISVTNISVTQTSFEDAPVTIQSDIEASGYAGKTVSVDLLESGGKLAERKTWNVSRNDDKQAFRFNLRPDKAGILFYQLNVAEALQDDSPDKPEGPSEATLANNQRTVVVDRGRGPYRILYVSGRPNWEYKFLRRAISYDEHVQLVGLLRVARREPKYDWRGRRGEMSNPLFRGFDNQDQEQTEQYDQPVLVRLGTRDDSELRDGFPKSAEDVFGYHAIILDDLEAGFFTQDQMDLLQQFVAKRGGGFLMLGGQESFQQGGFNRTPVGRMLPVYLDQQAEAVAANHRRLSLTSEGLLQPWVRLRDNEHDEQERVSKMPEFRVANRVSSVKPGAVVVAVLGNELAQSRDGRLEAELPALVVQRYGNGRAAALTIGDVWRWGLKEPEMHDDLNKFWRQTLRWLIADVPEKISLQVAQKRDIANQPVALQVRARDKDFEPMDNVSAVVEVRDPNGQTVRLTTEAVPEETGLFEAVHVPRFSGGYFAQAVVTDEKGNQLGQAEAGWAVDLEAQEFRSIKTNRALLERIARQTGGEVIELDKLDDFARSLPSRNVPVTTAWIKPLWDLPGVLPAIFAFILICFVSEWALRRWKGMP